MRKDIQSCVIHALGLCAALLACACSGQGTLVVVKLAGDTTGLVLLRSVVSVGGKDAKAPADFTGPLDQLGLQLPPGVSGKLQISVGGFVQGDNACVAALGSDGSQEVSGQPEIDLTITLAALDFRVCPSPDHTVNGIWGSSSTDVWFAGDSGDLSHWDGASLSQANTGTTAFLGGIWGSGPEDVWVVGAGGIAMHGAPPQLAPVPTHTTTDLSAVFGVDNVVWAVGKSGTILIWDGKTWQAQPSGTTEDLTGVWASSMGNAWAVGNSGTVLSWDGQHWSNAASGTTADLSAIWGSGATDVYAVGAQGTVLHYDGKAWMQQTSPTPSRLNAVWGTGRGSAIAAGAAGALIDGKDGAWTADGVNGDTSNDFWAVWGSPDAGDLWVAGAGGNQGVVAHFVPSS